MYRYKTKADCLRANNFNEAGKTFAIVGKNTYAIKDMLKEAGCRYNDDLGWHSQEALNNLPADCKCVEIAFDDIYTWDMSAHIAINKIANIKSYVRGLYRNENSASMHIGQPGDRLRNMTAEVVDIRNVPSWSAKIYVFKVDENLFTWFTTSVKPIQIGDIVDLTGTVKKHDMWDGEPATALSRCLIK